MSMCFSDSPTKSIDLGDAVKEKSLASLHPRNRAVRLTDRIVLLFHRICSFSFIQVSVTVFENFIEVGMEHGFMNWRWNMYKQR